MNEDTTSLSSRQWGNGSKREGFYKFIIQAEKFLNADWLKRTVFILNTCHIWKRVVFQGFDFQYLEKSSISRA